MRNPSTRFFFSFSLVSSWFPPPPVEVLQVVFFFGLFELFLGEITSSFHGKVSGYSCVRNVEVSSLAQMVLFICFWLSAIIPPFSSRETANRLNHSMYLAKEQPSFVSGPIW